MILDNNIAASWVAYHILGCASGYRLVEVRV